METCRNSGKDVYESEHEALKAISRKTGDVQYSLRVYKCNECYNWHLTSTKVRK